MKKNGFDNNKYIELQSKKIETTVGRIIFNEAVRKALA